MPCAARALWRVILISILAFPTVASTEPISFLFDVRVTDRFGTPTATPFTPLSFPLVATFDDTPIQVEREPDLLFLVYGQAQFSRIPLPAPKPYAGRSLEPELPTTSTIYFGVPSGYYHGAQIGSGVKQPSEQFSGLSNYYREVRLEAFKTNLLAPPDLNPLALAVLAGTPGDEPNFFFNVVKYRLDNPDAVPFQSYYVGSARFVGQVEDPAPVPEPSTLFLVGSGVLLAARRARRHVWRSDRGCERTSKAVQPQGL